MISVEEAVGRILDGLGPLGAEQVLLADAAGRVLAERILAPVALPAWESSAMDGYAVRLAEVAPGEAVPIAATIAAGQAPSPLRPGSCARIMTGAPMPAGADAVIMREDAEEVDRAGAEGGRAAVFKALPRAGQHVRRIGEDMVHGETLLEPGAVLGAGEIGLLASIGRTVMTVHRRPRVAIVSTGDELVEPDRAALAGREVGRIVGSNAWAVAAQCTEAGALPAVLPIARDDRTVIASAFEEALRADAVISTGGVSVGEFDFVKDALDGLGVRQGFWKVAMKPGKPIAFGQRDGRPVFGLPGNPASSMVTFELFVRPALRRLLGFAPPRLMRPRAEVALEEPYRNEGTRRHFVRAQVRRDGARLLARPNPRQGSGMLRSMVGVNALLDLGEPGTLGAGQLVPALLLESV